MCDKRNFNTFSLAVLLFDSHECLSNMYETSVMNDYCFLQFFIDILLINDLVIHRLLTVAFRVVDHIDIDYDIIN